MTTHENADYGKLCDTYWGSHGCHRPRGHDGPHWCDCCQCEDHARDHVENGCVAGPPYYAGTDTRFYGNDVREGEKKIDAGGD